MNKKIIVLIGFSTAGKSYFSNAIEELDPFEIKFQDSDKFVSKEFKGHIYNIFMDLGRDAALKYIENKEIEFIRQLSDINDIPSIVAAGPFLLTREGWSSFYEEQKPYIIYLKKGSDSVLAGLLERKMKQKRKLDTNSANFGSWDKDVTTKLIDGKYVDLSDQDSLININQLIKNVEPFYLRYMNEVHNSDLLKEDSEKSMELISAIIDRLRSD